MLEQMRKSGPAWAFVGGADVVPKVHGHDRRRVIFGQRNKQSVRQLKGYDRNAHRSKLHWSFERRNPGVPSRAVSGMSQLIYWLAIALVVAYGAALWMVWRFQ